MFRLGLPQIILHYWHTYYSDKGDYLTELRFFIPDNEEEEVSEGENQGEGEDQKVNDDGDDKNEDSKNDNTKVSSSS